MRCRAVGHAPGIRLFSPAMSLAQIHRRLERERGMPRDADRFLEECRLARSRNLLHLFL